MSNQTPSIADQFVQAMTLIERNFPRFDLQDPHRHMFRSLRDEADRALVNGINQAARMAHLAEELRDQLDAAQAQAKGE